MSFGNHSFSPRGVLDRAQLQALSLVLGLIAVWLLTHRYRGLVLDAEIYTAQALSRVCPYLATDIYLVNTSQDSYTVFSPMFGALIRFFGLIEASTSLFVLSTFLHIAALWAFIRRLFDAQTAFFAGVFAICCVLPYGAYHVFTTSEDYLTARSLAEGLVACSFACYVWDRRLIAIGVGVIAVLVHPLMALPGLLLLVCMSVPWRISAIGAVVGLIAAASMSALAAMGLAPLPALKAMDRAWLEVVVERSQFLFLSYWHWQDFALQLKPFVTIVFACMVLKDPRVRHWGYAAALVGITGLALAAIAGAIGPIPILIQGQAWRWTWITSTLAVCLVAPCAHEAWRSGGVGKICAALLVLGWIFMPIDGNLAVGAALVLWPLRARIQMQERLLNWTAIALLSIAAIWSLANVWDWVQTSYVNKHSDLGPLAFAHTVFGFQPLALLLAAAWWQMVERTKVAPAVMTMGVAIAIAAATPESLTSVSGFDLVRERGQYQDWRDAIPESSSVLLLPSSNTAGFVWITLQRTSYISVSQSAGVVFSPKTAAEIKRRSEVLLPVMQPDWRILSQIRQSKAITFTEENSRPLTAQSLTEICRDNQLGSVIAKENVGFAPVRHTRPGPYKDWNLYDCRRVRAANSSI